MGAFTRAVQDGLPGNRRRAGDEPLQRCGVPYSTSENTVPGKPAYSAAGKQDSAENDAKPDLNPWVSVHFITPGQASIYVQLITR